MKKPTKRLDCRQAYKLMEGKDLSGQPKVFDIKFVQLNGWVVTAANVICTSVDMKRRGGMRRIYYPVSEQWRWVYDVLILQINDTKIMVV